MNAIALFPIVVVYLSLCSASNSDSASVSATTESVKVLESDDDEWLPTVVISFLVRNKAHTLPLFLSHLEILNYPKDRINLWIRSDNNNDKSVEVLNKWLQRVGNDYNAIDYKNDVDDAEYSTESADIGKYNNNLWTVTRYERLMRLKEESLNYARNLGANYIFMVHADVVMHYSNLLVDLIWLQLPIVAPMILNELATANFWADEENSDQILSYERRGVFKVPLVDGAVLINLDTESSNGLTFDNRVLFERHHGNESINNLVVFNKSAKFSDIPMYIINEEFYAFVLTPTTHCKNKKIIAELPVHSDLKPYMEYPEKDTMTLDKIYMINLKKRPDRRRRMEDSFILVGLEVEYFEAVDGNSITKEMLRDLEIKLYPGYINKYVHRRMTLGEIGCFLSHYKVWTEMVEQNLREVLIIEDDVLFVNDFKAITREIMSEARSSIIDWDFIYFGRIRMFNQLHEKEVPGTKYLVEATFSYWTNGYVLSLAGAKKLIATDPLRRMLPVDEYIAIMYDQHPNETLASAFPTRNLIAWSTRKQIVLNEMYSGNNKVDHFSDTGNSEITTSDEPFYEFVNEDYFNQSAAADSMFAFDNVYSPESIVAKQKLKHNEL